MPEHSEEFVLRDRLSPKGRFGPTPADHPSIGDPCHLCGEAIEEGQVPSLVMLGPADEEEAAKAEAGRAYNAVAAVAHETCAYPEAPAALSGSSGSGGKEEDG